MMYNIIVAFDINRGIGMDNNLPWNIPEDLKYFSKLTRGNGNNAIIMGKNTWESLPMKPLPKRDNLILSSTLNINETSPKNNLIKSFTNIKDITAFCDNQQYDTVWIIGGSTVYNEYINNPIINKLYVTFILNEYKCDTYFPNISGWKLLDNDFKKINDNTYVYYQIYVK